METSGTWNSRLVTSSWRRSGCGSDFTSHRLHRFFCLWDLGTESKLRWHHPGCGRGRLELGKCLQLGRLGCITDAGGSLSLRIPVCEQEVVVLRKKPGDSPYDCPQRSVMSLVPTQEVPEKPIPSSLSHSLKIWKGRHLRQWVLLIFSISCDLTLRHWDSELTFFFNEFKLKKTPLVLIWYVCCFFDQQCDRSPLH